jgi:hypothetical protein
MRKFVVSHIGLILDIMKHLLMTFVKNICAGTEKNPLPDQDESPLRRASPV